MIRQRADDNTTSVSFLDVIACAFGAITLLVLILPIGDFSDKPKVAPAADYGRALWTLAALNEEVAALERQVTENDEMAAVLAASGPDSYVLPNLTNVAGESHPK